MTENPTPIADPAAPTDITTETAARLKAVDDAKLQQIVTLLEAAMDRADGAAAKTMLDQMRPQLVEARPRRRPTLRRLLCQPFEDMLVDGMTSGHVVGRIPRSAIMPVWALFLERGNKDIISQAEQNLTDKAAVAAVLDHFADVIKTELAEASAFATKGRSLLLRLGGETHYEALDVMLGAVSIARQIAKLKASLPPKPIKEFKDNHLDSLAEVLNQILKIAPSRIATALFIVMSRMAEPWKIANVLETLATTERFKSSAGINEFSSAALVGRLETQIQGVQAVLEAATTPSGPDGTAPSPGATAAALALNAGEAVQSLAGTRDALEKAGSKGQLREVERARQRLREVVDTNIVEGSAGAIVTALAQSGGSSPLGKRPDAAALRNAELRAVALRRSAVYAGLLALDGDVAENLKRATEGVEKAASEMFTQIRRGRPQGQSREAARAHIMGNARLMEILAGPEKAEQLLVRGLEAMGEQL